VAAGRAKGFGLARAGFLHWGWQLKFAAAKNVAHVVDKMLHACGGSGYKRDMELLGQAAEDEAKEPIPR
jgi:hypothetical protein